MRHIHDEAVRHGWPKLYFYPELFGEASAGGFHGECSTDALQPGIYTVRATSKVGDQTSESAQRQLILAPNPLDWR